jgi:hypothetical protein
MKITSKPLATALTGAATVGLVAAGDANGEETGLGTFDSPCKLEQGQNTTLAEFEIKQG